MKSLLYQSISILAQSLSLRQIHRLGGGLGVLMWHLLPKRRKLATAAVGLHLNIDRDQALEVARQSFQETGRSFLELFANRHLDFRFLQRHVHIEDPEQFFEIVKAQRPIVAATGHFGAWELLAGFFNLYAGSRPAQIIVYFPKDRALNQLLIHLRQHAATEVVTSRRSTVKISRCLRRNGVSAFLVDHNCTRRKAIFLPFLRKTAAVNMGPAYLAVLNKALVWPVFLSRNGSGLYTLHTHSPLDTCSLSGSKQEKIKATAAFYTRAVQKQVLESPEQWLWMHERWKTQPRHADESESARLYRKKAKREARNAEKKARNAERRTGKAEKKARNAERRTRKAEGQM